MKITKQQLKRLIKEEISVLLEVSSRSMRQATLDKPGVGPGWDQNPQKDAATLDSVQSISRRQPDGPIGENTIQNAIASDDFFLMKDTVLNSLGYLKKIRRRYAGDGTGGAFVKQWAKNLANYEFTEKQAETRKGFVKQDLESLLDFVKTGNY